MAIKASNLDTKRTGNSAAKKKKPITNTPSIKKNTQTVPSSSTDVKLQQSLQSAGYNPGNSSKETADAIMKYQKDNGLPMTGLADKATTTVLYGNEKANPNNAVSKLPTVPQPAVKPKADVPTVNTLTAQNSGSKISGGTQSTKPAPTTPTITQPAKEVKPFTYDDFSYDKQFSYDDFNYGKDFSYDDFGYGDFSYADYSQSDAVRQANALLQQQNSKKPGDYQSQWSDQIDDYMNRIQNRDPFSYDFNSDALYQQYKDNYIQQGQMAMMDTMGQAAAMTGGYGNSYAQNVGQQAYNQQLSQLNNVMPELYQMAYDRYANEGQQLQDMYNMYMGREEQDYGRYIDSLNAWQSERDYLANRYDTERDFDYNQYQQDRAMAYDKYSSDRNLAYDQWQKARDLAYNEFNADRDLAYDQYKANKDLAYNEFTNDRNMAYDKWSADREMAYNDYWNTINMDYQKQRDAVSDAQWQAEFNRKSSSGSGGGNPTAKTLTLDQINDLQNTFKRMSPEEASMMASLYASQLGVDPSVVQGLATYATGGLLQQNGIDTTVPTVTPTNTTAWEEEQEKRRNQQNGGGGGLKSALNRFTY